MKKLNITKEQFNKSRYFKNKYGKLEYVSESGRLFKTNKGKVLMFKESSSSSKRHYKVLPPFDVGDIVKYVERGRPERTQFYVIDEVVTFDWARNPENRVLFYATPIDKNIEYGIEPIGDRIRISGDTRYFKLVMSKEDYDDEFNESTRKSRRKFNESVNASMEYALSDWEDDFNESHGLEGNDKLNLGFYIGYETPGMFSIWGSIGFDGEQYMEEAVNELVQKFGLKKIGDIESEGGGIVQYFEWDIDKWGIPEMNYFSFMTDKGWTDKPGEILEGMLEYGYNVWEPAMRELFNPSK